jgi:membrane protease YdiL (CAAX protease family)
MPGLQLASLLSVATLALLALSGRLQFVTEEFPIRSRRILAIALLIATLATCVFFPVASGNQMADVDPEHIWFPSLFTGHAVLAGFLLLWWLLGRRQPVSQFLLLDRLSADDLQRGLWIGTAGWVITILGTMAIALPIGDTAAMPEGMQVSPFMLWLAQLSLARKLIVIAVAMSVEEAFFRAFLQTRIGWIPSSLLFALSHAGYGLPMLLVAVLIISLVIGRTLRQTGRLLPCIVAHGVFDAIQLLIVIPWAVKMMQGAT